MSSADQTFSPQQHQEQSAFEIVPYPANPHQPQQIHEETAQGDGLNHHQQVVPVAPVAVNTTLIMVEPPRDFRVDVQDVEGAPAYPSGNIATLARAFPVLFMGGFCGFGEYIISVKSKQEHYDSVTGGTLLVILNGVLFWFGVCCMVGSSIPYLNTGPGRSGCKCRTISMQKCCYLFPTGILCILCYAFFLAAGSNAGTVDPSACDTQYCRNMFDNDKARSLLNFMWIAYGGMVLTLAISYAFESYNRTAYTRFLHYLVNEKGMIVTGRATAEQVHPACRDEELQNVLSAIAQWRKAGAPAVVGQPVTTVQSLQ